MRRMDGWPSPFRPTIFLAHSRLPPGKLASNGLNQSFPGEYVERRENVIALGNSGTGKTHVALGLGLAACQKGLSVGFTTTAALVHELMEARDEKRLLRLRLPRERPV